MSVRIFIADDDQTIRLLLKRLLEGHNGEWQVCGEADSMASMSRSAAVSAVVDTRLSEYLKPTALKSGSVTLCASQASPEYGFEPLLIPT